MRVRGKLLALFSLCGALVVAMGLLVSSLIAPARGDEDDKGVLAGLISRALSSPGMRVSIGAVDGALSSDATIRDVVISDAQGPWLKVDRVRLLWTRSALLMRRLEVDRLEIGRVEFDRKPLPSGPPEKGAPLLPELPVNVAVRHFALDDLALGEPILGAPAHLSAKGHASLGDPSQGLDLVFDAERTDAPGSFKAALSFAPKSQNLKINIAGHEPSGGLLARVLALPGAPAADLRLDGEGTLDAFSAQLALAAGPDLEANGTLGLVRSGSKRKLKLSLAARVGGLLPSDLLPLAGGQSRLDASLALGDDRSVRIESAALVTSAARLEASGVVDSAGSLDLRASLRALASAPPAVFRAQRFDVDATATGTLKAPRLTATLDLAQVKIPAGGLESLKANLSTQTQGPLGGAGSRLTFSAQGAAAGLSFADPRLAPAVGRTLAFDLRGDLAPDGTAGFSVAKLTGDQAALAFVGQAGARAVNGRVHVGVDDLAAFDGLIGRDIAGSLRADIDLTGAPDKRSLSGAIEAEWDEPKTGSAALDRLIGARLAIKGALAQAGAKGFAFSDLRLSGQDIRARIDGRAAEDRADVNANIDIPDLRRADPRLSGRASAVVRMSGSLDRPGVTAHIALAQAAALGRAIPSMTLDISGEDLAGALSAHATLAGAIGAKTTKGQLTLARLPDGGWRLAPLSLAVGSSVVDGDLALSHGLASGRLSVKSGDLDDFSPLLLQKMGGRLDAALIFDAAEGRQNARLEAKAEGVRSSVFAASRLEAALTVSDATARPVIDGGLTISRAAFAGQTFARIQLLAKGAAGASALSTAIQARDWSMTGAGSLLVNDEPHLDLTSLDLRGRGHRIGLAAPAVLRLRDGAVQTDRLTLALDSGRIEIAGRAGRSLDLVVAAKTLPLAAAGLIAPQLGLSGTMEGQAHVAGVLPALRGDWRLNVSRLSSSATRSAGLPLIEASANGGFERSGAHFTANVTAGSGSAIRVAGFAPFTGGGLDLAAKGVLDAALATRLLPEGEKIAGKLALDLRATGSLAKPLVKGSTTLSGGSFADATAGLRLSDIMAQLTAQSDHVQIEHLSAQTPGGGSLSVSGRIDLAPAAGFAGELHIKADRARLLANDLGTATVNATIDASGPLARRPHVRGRIELLTMELAVPERLPHALQPLPNLRLIHPAPAAAARLALAARQKAKAAARQLPFDADIDLNISAANRIFVRGRGLDAEFGGQVALTGSLGKPIARGGFDLRRGSLDFLTQRLDLSGGRLIFAGGLIPDLEIAAQISSSGVTAQVSVTGPANEPVFNFSSTPALPQDEILSRILFAKPSGGLSPLQALQLADFATQLTGQGNRSGVFDKMRKSLGVDSFDVQNDASGNAQVGVSRYINNHMSVGVKTGANPENSAVSLSVDLTKRLRAQGQLGADGSSSAGVGMEWEY